MYLPCPHPWLKGQPQVAMSIPLRCCAHRTREILEMGEGNPFCALRSSLGEPERGGGSNSLQRFSTLWPLLHNLFPIGGPGAARPCLTLPSLFYLSHLVCVLAAHLCLTLCDPIDYSPLDSSVHGILQARILEGVTTPFSTGFSRPRDRTQVSRIAGGFFTV